MARRRIRGSVAQATARGAAVGLPRRRAAGQSLVEFSLVLTPLMVVLLGIIQMGLVFNAQVTITNAAREGARAATIYVYSRVSHSGFDGSKIANDKARADAALSAVASSMGILSTRAPQFSTSAGTWTQSGSAPNLIYTNGDIVVSYTQASATDSDTRTGEQVSVRITYHQDLMIPLIANLLPKDTGGRLAQGAAVTMVIN